MNCQHVAKTVWSSRSRSSSSDHTARVTVTCGSFLMSLTAPPLFLVIHIARAPSVRQDPLHRKRRFSVNSRMEIGRLPHPTPGELDDDQRAVYDAITGGPRGSGPFRLTDAEGRLHGPFNAMLVNPQLG